MKISLERITKAVEENDVHFFVKGSSRRRQRDSADSAYGLDLVDEYLPGVEEFKFTGVDTWQKEYETWETKWSNPDYVSEVENIYEDNRGDGHEMTSVLYFPVHNVYVQCTGTYSSWDSSEWDSCSFAEPFVFTETRYNNVSAEKARELAVTLPPLD